MVGVVQTIGGYEGVVWVPTLRSRARYERCCRGCSSGARLGIAIREKEEWTSLWCSVCASDSFE